jgi:hypothetical protein
MSIVSLAGTRCDYPHVADTSFPKRPQTVNNSESRERFDATEKVDHASRAPGSQRLRTNEAGHANPAQAPVPQRVGSASTDTLFPPSPPVQRHRVQQLPGKLKLTCITCAMRVETSED